MTSTRHRHPSDVARLVLALLVLGGLLLVEAMAPRGLFNLSVDLLTLVSNRPATPR